MNLRDQLDRLRVELRGSLDPADRRVLSDTIERLRMMQITEHALVAGDVLPDFALPDATGRLVTSDDLLARGPLVLVFFRGPWCPYCSLTLLALEDIRPEVEELGATLVGISPVKSEEVARAAAERGLHLTLLTDTGEAYARLCGLHFQLTPEHIDLYRRLYADIPAVHADAGWELPVPATFVVGQDGVIAYAYADADWARRAEPQNVLRTLRGLAQAATAA